MKNKISFLVFALFLTLSLGGAARVSACSCLGAKPVCEAFGNAKAVFIGEVISGRSPERMSEAFGGNYDLNFVFKVKEAFLNTVAGKEITVSTGTGFDDCGYPFQKGQTYLVYAFESNGALRASVCTRTRPLERVEKEDFEFLRNLSKQTAGGRLFGNATYYAKHSLEKDSIQPMTKLKLQVEQTDGKREKFEILTDEKGNYELKGLPAGKYKIEPLLPEHLKLSFSQKNDFQLNDKGCAKKDLRIENDSLVFVRVIEAGGAPVKNIWVELLPVDINPRTLSGERLYPEEFGVTNPEGGHYNFRLPPGRYTLSVNYVNPPDRKHPFPTTFYPGTSDRSKAGIIEVGLGTQIENLVIQLPPRLAEKVIKGTVYWTDRTPARDIEVFVTDETDSRFCINGCDYKTDAQGNFSLIGYQGRTYRVTARAEKNVNGKTKSFEVESELFTAKDNISNIKLTLATKKEN